MKENGRKMKKKGKRRREGKTLDPETAAAIQDLLERLKSHEDQGTSVETSLQELRSRLGVSPERDRAVVEALAGLPTARTAKILQSLLGFISDKKVAKAIRRSLYRIGQRGIPLETAEEPRRERSILRPLAQEEAKGLISAVDAWGGQLVFLTIPRKPKGILLLQGVIQDTKGLTDFDRVETTRRGLREFLQSLDDSGHPPIVESEPGYCRFRLEEAAKLTESREAFLPPSYLAAKKDLQTIERTETPPIFRLFNEEEIQADPRLLKDSPRLFETESFLGWFLPPEEIQKYADLLKEAEESRLVLNEAQKTARIRAVYQKAVADLFPEERRHQYRKRLEEMAYVLYKKGDEAHAKVSLAASIDLRRIPTSLDPNPFLMALVTRSIHALLAERMEEQEAEPSLIVKP